MKIPLVLRHSTVDRAMCDEQIRELAASTASEETQWRLWARENYVPLAERSLSWPLFALDEMRRLDQQPDAVRPPKLLLRVAKVPLRDSAQP